MEVLEIAAGGGQEGGVVLKGSGCGLDDPMIIGDDYLQGDDSEVSAAFSGTKGLIKIDFFILLLTTLY